MNTAKRPVFYCAIFFCLGISLAYFFGIPFVPYLISSLILIVLAVIFSRNNTLSHVLLYLALVSFGIFYYSYSDYKAPGHIVNFATEDGQKVLLKGRIADDPVTKKTFYGKKRITFALQAHGLRLLRPAFDGTRNDDSCNWQAASGLVKASLYYDEKPGGIRYGDEVMMKGVLSKPQGLKNPGIFDYTNYLKIKNIYAVFSANGGNSVRILASTGAGTLQGKAYLLKHRIGEAITEYIGRPYAGFLKAILTGDRTELESSVTDDFIKTGTVHVIAISGLHVGLIAALFLFVFKILRLPKRFSLILAASALIFYSFLTGSNPPVVRAVIIFAVFVLGYLIRREADALNSLAIAAFLILMWNPKELFDPSFQLSFASILSIILFLGPIEEMMGMKQNYIVKSVATSVAACLGVMPIVARYFNIFSPIAVAANIVMIPASFLIVSVSFVFLFFYFLGAHFLAGCTAALVSFLIKSAFYLNHLFSDIPFSYIRVSAPAPGFLFLYYAALFFFFFSRHKRYLFIFLLVFANLMMWTKFPAAQKKQLKITFLDVGKGDSMLLEFPDKSNMLIDAGFGGAEGFADMGRTVVGPYLWNRGIRKIDALMITHFHQDHMGGALYLLNNFKIGCVMDNGSISGDNSYLCDEYKKTVKRRNIRRLAINAGDEITGFDGAKLFVLNPAPEELPARDPNDSSIVMKLEYKNFGALFCADISSNAMEGMMSYASLLKSDVLKIPHHGGSIGKEYIAAIFFNAVSPKISVISTGGKPGSRGREREKSFFKSAVYSTVTTGAIDIASDGTNFEVGTFCRKN